MNITDRLNSGALHAQARKARPDCVDTQGNLHCTPERAAFMSWRHKLAKLYGDDVKAWPFLARAEFKRRYVPSH